MSIFLGGDQAYEINSARVRIGFWRIFFSLRREGLKVKHKLVPT